MVERRAAPVMQEAPRASDYFSEDYISSGSFLLDLALGGGWCRGRVANVVGDKSSGKTLLAIEACANFAKRFEEDNIRYAESEAAFLDAYAAKIGMPPGAHLTDETNRIETVEQLYEDLSAFLQDRAGKTALLYVLDSLDSLSDAAELEREFGEGTYGTGKAKAMSEMFRRLVGDLRDKDCLLFIISQVRDNIGVTFGETKKRSGGKALDFYASQVLWLAETGKIKHTVRGVERVTGSHVRARCKKNKVGTPFREVDIDIVFSYGVDDESSMIEWLKKNKGLDLLDLSDKEARKRLDDARQARDRAAVVDIRDRLQAAVYEHWMAIEADLEPPLPKY